MMVKKRQILTATLVIALLAAVTVNWYYNNPDTLNSQNETSQNESVTGNLGDSMLVAGTVSDSSTDNYDASTEKIFADAKITRTNSEDKIKDYIDEILSSDKLTEKDKADINKHLEEYINIIKTTTDAENLIKAKTGRDCVVIINDGSCQVIVQKNSLNDAVILQITEIIQKNTNIFAENLTIIESK